MHRPLQQRACVRLAAITPYLKPHDGRVAAIIKGYPEENHGDMCIAAFRELQMAVRPATEPGLWDRPARPSVRVLLPDGSGNMASLDKQLRDFAGVVAGMILDYPKEHHANICSHFLNELRALSLKVGYE
jgi:hypothetical protein